MKKLLGFTFICSIVLILSGCSNKIETMTCSRTMNQGNMKLNLNYTVDYKGDYVVKVKSEETIESENVTELEAYKTQIENIYKPYKDIEHYEYSVVIEDSKLISTVNIDYEKIDTTKMIDIDSANGQFIKDGRIKVEDIKTMYENAGAICK
ncbi:MAG: DUF1307 domain-containing protein [Firmicutes bacterium]|nr:DUF1307 domain-containing protein [Bacillota bacterium]